MTDASKSTPRPPKVRTWEQPLRDVVRRYPAHSGVWASLVCGHEEPVTRTPIAAAVRCQQCDPVMRPLDPGASAAKAVGW